MTQTAPAVILVEPQMGENIGASARAMANFGLNELRIVAPRDGWPNEKATAMAAHADSIIEQAKIYPSTEEAIADLQLVYAATARPRHADKPVYNSQDAFKPSEMEPFPSEGLGLVFGPERSGLTNKDITLANAIVTIPVNPASPSINLAQSVMICCYEWSLAHHDYTPRSYQDTVERATQSDVQGMLKHLEDTLDEAEFFRVEEKREGMLQNIFNIFKRIDLSTQEVRTLRGIIRCLSENRR